MKENDYQGRLLYAAKEIQNAVLLSQEIYFVIFGIIISTQFADNKVEIKAEWWTPEKQETSVTVSAEALASCDKPEWLLTIRRSFNMLDQLIKEERFKEFQRRKSQ